MIQETSDDKMIKYIIKEFIKIQKTVPVNVYNTVYKPSLKALLNYYEHYYSVDIKDLQKVCENLIDDFIGAYDKPAKIPKTFYGYECNKECDNCYGYGCQDYWVNADFD